jgi:hypothetical protein
MAEKPELSKDPQAGQQPKVPRHRSPNYPAFSLRRAVEKAKDVYDAYKQVQVPITTVHTRWSYEQMSGVVLQTVAALKAYGLVDVDGDKDKRMIRLTDAAVKIIRGHPDRLQLLRDAALSPSVYAELWEKYKADGIPPDDILTHCLEWELHFNPNAIGGFIADFRDTIAFANLIQGDIIGQGGDGDENANAHRVGGENPPAKVTTETPPPQKAELHRGGPDMSTDVLTLDAGTITLQCPHELTEADYMDLKDWIEIKLRRIKRNMKTNQANAIPKDEQQQ